VFRQRLNYPDLKRAIIELVARYEANTVLIEDRASGIQLIQELKADCVFGVTAYKPPPGTDKIMRLHAQTAMIENGFVFLPRMALWLDDYINELITFPGARHDDQVDSTTQFLDYIRTSASLEVWTKLGGG
jgi:predicted phage terminase large subunit-like protein